MTTRDPTIAELRAELARLDDAIRTALRAEIARWPSRRHAAHASGVPATTMHAAAEGRLALDLTLDALDALRVLTPPAPPPPTPSARQLREDLQAEVARVGGGHVIARSMGHSRTYVTIAMRALSVSMMARALEHARTMPDAPRPRAQAPIPTAAIRAEREILRDLVRAEAARIGGYTRIHQAVDRRPTGRHLPGCIVTLHAMLDAAATIPSAEERRAAAYAAKLAAQAAKRAARVAAAAPPKPPRAPKPPPVAVAVVAPPPKPPKPQRPYIARLADAAVCSRCTVWWGGQVLYRDPSGDAIEPAPRAAPRVATDYGEARYREGRWTGDPLLCERIRKIVI